MADIRILGRSPLVINVNPNLPGKRNWRVAVERHEGNKWLRICHCRTAGKAEKLVLTLPVGTYRVRALSRKGYRKPAPRTITISAATDRTAGRPNVAPAGQAVSPASPPTAIPTPTLTVTGSTPTPTLTGSSSGDVRTAAQRGLAWYQANTGVPVGAVLKASGSITVNTAGAVIEGLDVNGTITVNARNVTIRNTRVKGSIINRLNAFDQNLLIDHVEVDVTGLPIGESQKYAINSSYGTTLRNIKAHGMSQGIAFLGHTNVYDSWIYGIRSNGTHSEAILSNGDSSAYGGNAIIARNWLDADETNAPGFVSGALCMYGDWGQIRNTIVDGNHMTGDGYLLYPGAVTAKPYPTPYNVTVTNNTFAPTGYGPVFPSTIDPTSTTKWAANTLTNGTTVPAPTGNR